MQDGGGGGGLLREGDENRRTTFVELLFDLVYVLAITQLTHLLVANLNFLGAVRTLLLLFAVWWAWVDTAWVTNWFDPNRTPVRLMLVGVMILSLIMSATLPQAFGDRGHWFAGAYVTMQVGRTAFAAVALGGRPGMRRNFERILVWKLFSGLFWIAGAFPHGPLRLIIWGIAVVIEYSAAAAGFYTPRLGRSTPSDWRISGRHLAERAQLFVLIALGESILITGSVFGSASPGTLELAALAISFLGSVALWWIYFDRSAEAASTVIAEAGEPGRIGRSAYTYHHLPMVAGVIVTAVGDELVISHPTGHPTGATIAAVLGGPGLFLAGHALFKRAVFGHLSPARPIAVAILIVLAPVGPFLPPLVLAAAATLTVAAVAVWDGRAGAVPETTPST